MIVRGPAHRPARRTSLRGGFTLIELAVTIAITSVIMLGIASAMLIAGHAVPEADNPVAAGIAAGNVLEQMATELQYAVSVIDSNATMIEFAVADRDGNDVPETIRYEWSGTPGDPLTRQYNGGTASEVLADVNEFNLSYDRGVITTQTPQGNESAETLLSSYDSTQDLHDYPIKDTERYAQYFLPTLPADTISWKVTRLRFFAKADATNDGHYCVQAQLPTAGDAPSGIVLEAKWALESGLLDTYTQQEVSFSNVSGLSPQQGLCLVFRWIANATSCKLYGQDRNVSAPNGRLLKSTDREASWSVQTAQSLLYEVYGTVTTTGTPQVQDTYYLGGVTLTLQTGGHDQSAVQTAVRVLNGPEVTS